MFKSLALTGRYMQLLEIPLKNEKKNKQFLKKEP